MNDASRFRAEETLVQSKDSLQKENVFLLLKTKT
jgi:hypothetical protein